MGNIDKLNPENYLNEKSIIITDIMTVKETAFHLVESFTERTRAFVQIQNGCNHRCTFCTIPFARGNNRSVPIGEIVRQIQALVSNGAKEIVLTGVDITDFGDNLPKKPKLAKLLAKILEFVPTLPRLRLSSVDVAEIDEELFDLISTETRIMPHIHISMQSGNNKILKRMRRRHTREQVLKFCNDLKKKRPSVTFGSDLIVGFPTEDEQMFAESLNLLIDCDMPYTHVFPFSAHQNTPASRMPQVAKDIIKQRAKIAREVTAKIKDEFYLKLLQSEVDVLIEKHIDNYSIGRAENFAYVAIKGRIPIGETTKTIAKKILKIDKYNYLVNE